MQPQPKYLQGLLKKDPYLAAHEKEIIRRYVCEIIMLILKILRKTYEFSRKSFNVKQGQSGTLWCLS